MGYNVGFYGSLDLTAEGEAAWRKLEVGGGRRPRGWPREFEPPKEATRIGALLGRLAKLDRPRGYSPGFVSIERPTAERLLLFGDLDEDAYRQWCGAIASAVAAVADAGGAADVVFLGTAGAEGDFAHRLTVVDRRAALAELPAKERRRVYRSAGYAALGERTSARLEARDPAFAAQMKAIREGTTPTEAPTEAYEGVVLALRRVDPEVLRARLQRLEVLVPSGKR